MSRLTRLLLSIAWSAAACPAQSGTVRGELQEDGSVISNGWVVQLRPLGARGDVFQADVRGGGTFELRNVPVGSYMLSVVGASGDVVAEQPAEVGNGSFLRVRLNTPEHTSAAGPARTVPVSELRAPPSKKAIDALVKAKRHSDAGDRDGAVRELERAAKELPGDGYVRTNLGLEYLLAGNLAAATPVLEEAARLLPDSAMTRGNLAYAYYLASRWDEAAAQARAALAADHVNPKMRHLLEVLQRGAVRP